MEYAQSPNQSLDTVNSTVYETHLRDNHTKEQMAKQIAMRMIDSLEGH
jgi:hypothetical protein